MMKVFFIFVAFAAACHGAAVESVPRQRNANASFASYFIYTRDSSRFPVRLFPTDESAITTNVWFRAKTAIIVHGHEASGFTSLNPTVKDAFLSSEDINVIVVDWSEFANRRYSEAVAAVPMIGRELANFISSFASFQRISLNRLHLVGFDLGAHVVGFTGRALGGNVARITGLDPSGSRWGSNSERLRATDAQYVEVIHTDGDGVLANGLGTPIGHVDFFPNGGSLQPGCFTHTCCHERAWKFFAASLTHDHLIGNQCDSMLQVNTNRCRGYQLAMGNNDFIKYGSGVYRINTRRTYPY